MDHQIELTHKFLDLIEIHPAQADKFYQYNRDAIDLVLNTWKKYRNELIKIRDKKEFVKTLKERMLNVG